MDDQPESTEIQDATSTADESQVDATTPEDAGQADVTASPEEGAAAETPAFDAEEYQRRIDQLEVRHARFDEAYNTLRSENARIRNATEAQTRELAELKKTMAAASDAELMDPDFWADVMSDPKKGLQFIDQRATAKARALVDEEMTKRFDALRLEGRQQAAEATEVAARQHVMDLAGKYKMTQEEFRDMHLLNPGLEQVPAQEYARLATKLMDQAYKTRLALDAPARSAAAATEAAAQRIARGGAGTSAPVRAGSTDKTPSQAWLEYIKGGDDDDMPTRSL